MPDSPGPEAHTEDYLHFVSPGTGRLELGNTLRQRHLPPGPEWM